MSKVVKPSHISYNLAKTSKKIYQLTVCIDNKSLTVHSSDCNLLERLGHIIVYNKIPYKKANHLCQLVQKGDISMGNIPNIFLYSEPAYRVIHSYSNHIGAICAHYETAEKAFESPVIQASVAEAAVKYGFQYDYGAYSDSINKGNACRFLHYTILYSYVTNRGFIIPIT